MKQVFDFGLLGLGVSAAYALLAQGLVVIYRGSGVLNFAQGAYATVGAYVYVELHQNHHNPFALSFVIALLATAAIGAATHLLIMRPLRVASSLTRVIATLGVLSIITGIGAIRYGANQTQVAPFLPQNVVHILGAAISVDRLWMLLVATLLTGVLYAVSRYTTVGLAMTATSENQRAASSLGWSPDVFATATWALGGALAATAGIFIVPLSGLQVTNLTVLVIAAMAAALFGDFTSYPRTWAAAVVIGIGVSETNRYVTQPGWSTALPFLVIMLVVVFRGRSLPLRSQVLDRLPRLGSGIPRVRIIVVLSVFVIAGMLSFFPQALTIAIGVQVVAGLMLLSVVVLTGYAGQLSLGQFALAGMGAFVAGRLVGAQHIPFALALLVGLVVAVPIGMIFALPALRTRGVTLAVVTLGLGVSIQAVLFENPSYTGGIAGTNVGAASFLGINLDPINHPERYAVFCMAWFILACLLIANVRRGRVGRRLVAIRTNERAAASLGISALESKMFAFGLSSTMAALGGILLAFQSYSIIYSNFDPITSISLVGGSVIGGVGFVTGTIPGSGFYPGGIGSYILSNFGSLEKWLTLFGGIALVVTLLLNPDGIVGQLTAGKVDPLTGAMLRRIRAGREAGERARVSRALPPGALSAATQAPKVRDTSLSVEDLTVRFGGVVAVSGVSLQVAAGEVLGLIGPNGAGKTTMIDAISGFTRQSSGSVVLNGEALNQVPAYRRARAGISRSWQSVELFEDLTVLENLQAASDPRDRFAYVTNLVRTDNRPLSTAAAAAVEEFKLTRHLNEYPNALSYGTRRLVSIARAVAAGPSILLLDEPAAGLDDAETLELSALTRRLADVWGLGILLVEHDMSIVMTVCDRVAVLDFGQKIAEGPPHMIRHDPAVIACYLGEPVEGDGTAASDRHVPPASPRVTTDP